MISWLEGEELCGILFFIKKCSFIMISSNYDQVAVNSNTIQKVVSRKCKKYIQKYATDAAGNVWKVEKGIDAFSD